jgi:hypothetical protein
MTWQEMSDEIVMDVAQITLASAETEYVIAVIQWQGQLLAAPVYQPNIFPLEFHDRGTPVNVNGIAILPPPATAPQDRHWRPIELKVTPKKNGSPTTEDTPVMYLVCLKKAGGAGVALPSRCDAGWRVQWSANPEVIDHVREALVKSGILIRADRPAITK